jgi:hypothetical protein
MQLFQQQQNEHQPWSSHNTIGISVNPAANLRWPYFLNGERAVIKHISHTDQDLQAQHECHYFTQGLFSL